MTPEDIAVFQSACARESDIIATDIARGIEWQRLRTFQEIEEAIQAAVSRSPLAQPAWIVELFRSMPSAFALNQATLDRVVSRMRERVAPADVRRRLEARQPARYRDATPLVSRLGGVDRQTRDNPHTHALINRLLTATTDAELAAATTDGFTAIIRIDYDDFISRLVDHIAQRVAHGELRTGALIEGAINDAVANCPFTQPEWLAAYFAQLPGHPPLPESGPLAKWMDTVRREMPSDIRPLLAIRLPELLQSPKARPKL